MSSDTNLVQVQYIGRRTEFIDRIYGTKLTFVPDQVRPLPAHIARLFVRHADSFKVAEAAPVEGTDPDAAADTPPSDASVDSQKAEQTDDTAATLEAAQKEQDDAALLEARVQDVRDQVNTMDKDALKEFAQVNYGQSISKTFSVENLRVQVLGFIDQYGVV